MGRLFVCDSRPELARAVGEHLGTLVQAAVRERDWCSLALPGGSFVRPIYDELALLQLPWQRVDFFFTDERGVRPDHPASNYGEALDRLFRNPRIGLHQVHRIEAEGADHDAVCELYERELPESFDAMLVGIETDGAIAALHPGSPAFDDERAVVPVETLKKPRRRVTVGPAVVDGARELVVVALGPDVAPAVSAALALDGPALECPARLARRGSWFLDRAAASALPPGAGVAP